MKKSQFFEKWGIFYTFLAYFRAQKADTNFTYQSSLKFYHKSPLLPSSKRSLSSPSQPFFNPISHPSLLPSNPSKSNDINQRYLNNNLNIPPQSILITSLFFSTIPLTPSIPLNPLYSNFFQHFKNLPILTYLYL